MSSTSSFLLLLLSLLFICIISLLSITTQGYFHYSNLLSLLIKLIRGGDIDSALVKLREWYPQLVQVDYVHHCLPFMIVKETKKIYNHTKKQEKVVNAHGDISYCLECSYQHTTYILIGIDIDSLHGIICRHSSLLILLFTFLPASVEWALYDLHAFDNRASICFWKYALALPSLNGSMNLQVLSTYKKNNPFPSYPPSRWAWDYPQGIILFFLNGSMTRNRDFVVGTLSTSQLYYRLLSTKHLAHNFSNRVPLTVGCLPDESGACCLFSIFVKSTELTVLILYSSSWSLIFLDAIN